MKGVATGRQRGYEDTTEYVRQPRFKLRTVRKHSLRVQLQVCSAIAGVGVGGLQQWWRMRWQPAVAAAAVVVPATMKMTMTITMMQL